MLRHSFEFLLQVSIAVSSRLSRPRRSCAHSCLSCDNIFLLRHSSFLQYDNSVAIKFPLSRQYSIHSSNMNVATSILMSQHSFSATSTSWCRDQSFHVAAVMLICFFKLMLRPRFSCRDNISFLVLVATLSCIIVISVASQKVCRDGVLSPLSPFPCCSFIFYVAT